MKATYKVTLSFPDSESLSAFLNSAAGIGSFHVTVERPEAKFGAPTARREPPPPAKLRGSKVNEAIVARMREGTASIAELKEALEKAGMSAGSLSTGLAQLQRNGTVERVDDGVYGLKHFKAAE